MTPIRPAWLAAAAVTALATIALAGCAVAVRSYVDRRADFSQYRTYAWGAADTFTTGDPRLDNNTFFRDRLQKAADARFAARGFEQTELESADLVLHYHMNVTQRIDVNQMDQQYGYCDDCRAEVYDAGTLTLDLVETRTGRLVWRGWSERSLSGVLDDQDWMDRQVEDAVAQILERLPIPRS
jgi:hypothetical protein